MKPLWLLLLGALLGAEDYYLSYRLYSRNFLIRDEHLYLSRAMVPLEGKAQTLCTFDSDETSFKAFAKRHTQPLLECLFAHGVLVKSRDEITDLVHHHDTLELILPPVPLKVDFNDGLVIIKRIVPR